MEEIKLNGYISHIIFPKDGNFEFYDGMKFASFILVSEEKSIKCAGQTFPIFKGAEVTLTGYFEDTEYGKTFRFSSLLLNFNKARKNVNYCKYIVGPQAYNNLIKYVRWKYDVTGNELDKKAKEFLVEMLENEDIVELKKVLKLTHSSVAKEFIKRHQVNKNLSPAYEKLNKYGLKLKDVEALLKKEANIQKVIENIEKNPYKLINTVGISFRKADIIYARNKGKTNSRQRIIASIFEALRVGYDEDGNCFLREDELLKKVFIVLQENYFDEHVDVDIKDIKDSISKLVTSNNIVLQNERYYLKDSFKVQEFLKDFCRKAIASKPYNYNDVDSFIEKYEAEHKIKLGNEQKQSVRDAVNHKIHIITGGAGVGKTSSLACILSYFLDEIGYKEEDICLVAPTGKASQRMTESVNKQIGGNHKMILANTIHSTLKVDVNGAVDGKLETFFYNSKNKMNCKIVVCDETSMNDYKISYALLSALKDDCRVIFLGDIGQLEPVGAGFFFRDAIESGIPTTYLNEIHRQKGESTIISISQAIRNEKMVDNNLDRKIDFSMIELSDSFETNLKNAVKIFMISVKKVGIDQTMMITPLRETEDNNKLDSKTLSIAIQKEYLPDKEGEPVIEKNGFKFKIGSKIIITKNNREKELINGAIGYITDIIDETIIADFDGEEKALIGDDLKHLRLGYAITVHKSQGSDWKNVIYVCSKETVMNTKNLVYTAVTRAKDKLVIFGNKETVENSQWIHPKRKNSVLLNEKVE